MALNLHNMITQLKAEARKLTTAAVALERLNGYPTTTPVVTTARVAARPKRPYIHWTQNPAHAAKLRQVVRKMQAGQRRKARASR